MTAVTEHRRDQLPSRRYGETFELQHGGKRAVFQVTLGRYPDGRIGEVFISGGKSGTESEANLRDGAILASLALQHGVPIATMAAAITREGDGAPSTIIGVVLDQLAKDAAA
jgi:hypothetical protein